MEILLTTDLSNVPLERITILFILKGIVYFFRIKWVMKMRLYVIRIKPSVSRGPTRIWPVSYVCHVCRLGFPRVKLNVLLLLTFRNLASYI